MIDTIREENGRPDAGQEAENVLTQQRAHPVQLKNLKTS